MTVKEKNVYGLVRQDCAGMWYFDICETAPHGEKAEVIYSSPAVYAIDSHCACAVRAWVDGFNFCQDSAVVTINLGGGQ